jgi:hypothetical protein
MNDVKQSFKHLVKNCLEEVKEERKKKQQLREALKKYVRSVLKEVISGPNLQEPEKDEKKKSDKQFSKDRHEPTEQTQDKQVQELTKIAHGINQDFNVYRETIPGGPSGYTSGKRSFVVVDAGDIFTVRIRERWENNFDIEAMIRQNDRIIAIGLSWEQVKSFVKANFSEINKTQSVKALDKVDKNREDQVPSKDDDMPDTTKGIKTKDISNKAQEDGDEKAEDMVKKDEDEPSAQMKKVTKPGEDPETKNKAKDLKKTPQVKPPGRVVDKELVKKMPGKKR